MPTCVVFDCESDGKPTPAGDRGEKDFRYVRCTCACTLVVNADNVMRFESAEGLVKESTHITFWQDNTTNKGKPPFSLLLDLFDSAEIIVGFNAIDFDFPLLWKHYGNNRLRYDAHRFKTHDIFTRVRAFTPVWPSLNSLLLENKLATKSGDGANAIKLWEAQRRDELEAYCQKDVLLTLQLALLPRIKYLKQTIPAHVYHLLPALQACYAATAMAARTRPPPMIPAAACKDETLVPSTAGMEDYVLIFPTS